jgi:PAS domain S-box-containing protein
MTSGDGSIDVLHVDDDPDMTEVAARFLEREDPRLAVATESEPSTALDRLADETFDCIVSDYDMPRMDGLEFFEAVRGRHPDVPFVLFTGKGSEAVAGEAVSAGVTDYLQKESSTEQYRLLANRITNAVDQSRTAARLDEERRRFRVLFEQFTQPTVEVEYEDEEPIVRRVNPAFEEVFGYPAEEVVGESLDEYIVPDDHETEAEQINSRVREGARLAAEPVTRRTADGTRAFLLQNAVYPNGSGGFAIYMDITDRRERERLLEERTDRLDELVSVISHDLRNPLSVVAGHLEMARDGTDSHHVERALGAAERSQNIVGDLLTLAHEEDRVTDPSPVALDDIARNCWRDVTTGTAALAVEAGGTVRADRSRLRQLLENLIRNAVEHGSTSPPSQAREDAGSENASEPSVAHAPEDAVEHSSTSPPSQAREDAVEHGGEAVEITVGNLEDDEGFYVADDGPGIPEADREKVFESGFSTSEEGTGFGLAIVNEIAAGHGWEIRAAESEAGGACFKITGVDRL